LSFYNCVSHGRPAIIHGTQFKSRRLTEGLWAVRCKTQSRETTIKPRLCRADIATIERPIQRLLIPNFFNVDPFERQSDAEFEIPIPVSCSYIEKTSPTVPIWELKPFG
jgi:hypothetical protein